jgi:hypothetical protein
MEEGLHVRIDECKDVGEHAEVGDAGVVLDVDAEIRGPALQVGDQLISLVLDHH